MILEAKFLAQFSYHTDNAILDHFWYVVNSQPTVPNLDHIRPLKTLLSEANSQSLAISAPQTRVLLMDKNSPIQTLVQSQPAPTRLLKKPGLSLQSVSTKWVARKTLASPAICTQKCNSVTFLEHTTLWPLCLYTCGSLEWQLGGMEMASQPPSQGTT
jgi:hypothetical protein